MIHGLDKTIKKLILDEIKADNEELHNQIEINFDSPDNDFPPNPQNGETKVIVNLFLYDIRENTELRTGEAYSKTQIDYTKIRTTAYPYPVDFSYIVTAWSVGEENINAENEHHVLGSIMRVLLRYRDIKQDRFDDNLPDRLIALRAMPVMPNKLNSIGEFWSAMGNKPKAMFNYTITAAIDVYKPIDSSLPRSMTAPSLTNDVTIVNLVAVCRIIDAVSGEKINDVSVIAFEPNSQDVSSGIKASSLGNGYYNLYDLPVGSYKLAIVQNDPNQYQPVADTDMLIEIDAEGKPILFTKEIKLSVL